MERTDFLRFAERYQQDKKELIGRFDVLNKKLQSMDARLGGFDESLERIDKRLDSIDEMQQSLFTNMGEFKDKLDNVKVFLSMVETKLSEFKTLHLQGEKRINGELYMLKIKFCKVRPIINWENNEVLSKKYKELEQNFLEFEEEVNEMV